MRSQHYYVRFGRWHENEISSCPATGQRECGVSVFAADPPDAEGRYDIRITEAEKHQRPGSWGLQDTFYGLVAKHIKSIEDGGAISPVLVVTGRRVGWGHDGEPLLKEVRLVREIAIDQLTSTDLDWDGRNEMPVRGRFTGWS